MLNSGDYGITEKDFPKLMRLMFPYNLENSPTIHNVDIGHSKYYETNSIPKVSEECSSQIPLISLNFETIKDIVTPPLKVETIKEEISTLENAKENEIS
jgi:hypothetical protein